MDIYATAVKQHFTAQARAQRVEAVIDAFAVHTSCACEDGVDMSTYWNRWGMCCSACHREIFSEVAPGVYDDATVERMNAEFARQRSEKG